MKFHSVSSILHGYPLIRMISRVPSHGWEIWHSGPELCASIGLPEEASPKGDVRRRDSVRLSVLGPSTGLRASHHSRNTDLARRCQPVCMQTTGVTRTKVGDYKCSGEKPTHCSCRCYYGGLGIQLGTVLSHISGAGLLLGWVLELAKTST